jgi:8-oxo-dGTP pyrophosphatase MutT (NUDIX family)
MRNYWGRRAAGIAFICQNDSTVLLVKRSQNVNEPGTWGLPGGRVEPGEHPFTAAVREVEEELGSAPEGVVQDAHVFQDRGFEYTTYYILISPLVKARWTPTIVLNWENDEAGWFYVGDLPEPLHFGIESIREDLEMIAGV